MIRRYLACHPSEAGRVYRLLDRVMQGEGPVHLQVASAAEIGFNLAGPIQLF